MKIDLQNIKVSDLIKGYEDKGEAGVRGHGGHLNIRPAYQREFIYKETQRNEVINTVRKDFPLNTMYWVVAGDGFELMDGQQRTISICQYVHGDFAVEVDGAPRFFNNLTAEKQKQILDYELSVYVCEGSEPARFSNLVPHNPTVSAIMLATVRAWLELRPFSTTNLQSGAIRMFP